MSKDRPLTCFEKREGREKLFESPGLLLYYFFHLIDVKGTVSFDFPAYVRQHVCHKNRPHDIREPVIKSSYYLRAVKAVLYTGAPSLSYPLIVKYSILGVPSPSSAVATYTLPGALAAPLVC